MISVAKSGSKSARKCRRKDRCHICGKDHPFWFNAAKQGFWYLSIPDASKANGYRQERLSKDHDEAKAMWHQLSAGLPVTTTNRTTLSVATTSTAERSIISAPTYGETMLVGELVGMFLENKKPNEAHSENKKSKSTKMGLDRYRITKGYLDELCRYMGADSIGSLRVGGCNRVEKWLDAHPTWQGSLRSVVSRVKQVFKWGEDQGYIASSPLKALVRPSDNTRVTLFTETQVQAIIVNSTSEAFTQAFKILLATGCRPDEFCTLTADDVRVDENGELYWWVVHKNLKHTGERRRVYLPKEIEDLTRKAMASNPVGALFKNKRGWAWTPNYLNDQLRKVTAKPDCVALGLDRFEWCERKGKNGRRYRKYEMVIYTARHTFAHRLLTGFYQDADGRPLVLNYGEVATFMGNSAVEVEKTYGKLAKATNHLSSRLRGVSV